LWRWLSSYFSYQGYSTCLANDCDICLELEGIWQDFFVRLGLQKPLDPKFVNQTLFDSLAMNHFGAASHANPPLHLPSTSLNFDEETF